jgi:YD repeat-containing protein
MKFSYLISAFAIVLSIISCSPKSKKEEPKPIANQNITSLNRGGFHRHEMTYDSLGNLITDRQGEDNHEALLKISYEKNLAKTISFELNNYNQTRLYTLNYVNANEITIESDDRFGASQWLSSANLKFNASGLVESITTKINFYTYTFNYRYDAKDNLTYAETVESFTKPVIYEDYDDKPNPYYAKAKLWTIINLIKSQNFRLNRVYPFDFVISKNNPRKSFSQAHKFYEKLSYTYDENSYPVKVTRHTYVGSNDTPPLDSDYKLDPNAIEATYKK